MLKNAEIVNRGLTANEECRVMKHVTENIYGAVTQKPPVNAKNAKRDRWTNRWTDRWTQKVIQSCARDQKKKEIE